jgi:hypothetical protein
MFIQLAVQQVYLQQCHHKYMSNGLPCVAMTAATSPGNKNLSAPLKAYDTTIVYVVCT